MRSRKLTRMKPNRRYGFDAGVTINKSPLQTTESRAESEASLDQLYFMGSQFELKKASKNIRITGRGGTDFQCAVDYYENHPEFQGMIIFTDGYAEVPKITKAKQMLWILTSKNEYDYAMKWIKDLRLSKATWIPSLKSS